MGTFWDFFDGKKTYLIAAAMVVVAGLQAQGYIGPETYRTIEGILLGGGFMALRSAVNK